VPKADSRIINARGKFSRILLIPTDYWTKDCYAADDWAKTEFLSGKFEKSALEIQIQPDKNS
jgi:hypothetical protein